MAAMEAMGEMERRILYLWSTTRDIQALALVIFSKQKTYNSEQAIESFIETCSASELNNFMKGAKYGSLLLCYERLDS